MKEKRCKNCECWEPKDIGGGICKARAPSTIPLVGNLEGKLITLVQPTTNAEDGCYHDYVPAEAT